MTGRIIATIVCLLMLFCVNTFATKVMFPIRAMDVGVRQLEDSNVPFAEVQTFEASRKLFSIVVFGIIGTMLVLMWYKPIIGMFGYIQ